MVILPTGFGKILIFQLLVRVKEVLTKESCYVVVVCSLKNMTKDQVTEATFLGLKAKSLFGVKLKDEDLSSCLLLFASAEEVFKGEHKILSMGHCCCGR